MTLDPHGWTIFCDDIREEIGGKSSFIGVYKDTLIVHGAFPARIPKFALAVHYRIAKDDRRLEDVDLFALLPGDKEDAPSFKTVIPVKRMLNADSSPTDPSDEFRVFNANILLTPLLLKQEGRIMVRAKGGAGLIKLGALKIEQRLPAELPPGGDRH